MRASILLSLMLLAGCVTAEYHPNQSVTTKGILRARITEIDEYSKKFTSTVEFQSLYRKSIFFYFGEILCHRKSRQGAPTSSNTDDIVLRPGELKRLRIVCVIDADGHGGPFSYSIGRVFEAPAAAGKPPGKQISKGMTIAVNPSPQR